MSTSKLIGSVKPKQLEYLSEAYKQQLEGIGT